MLDLVYLLALLSLILVGVVPGERRRVRLLGVGLAVAVLGLAFWRSALDGKWWMPLLGVLAVAAWVLVERWRDRRVRSDAA
ncbi:hypothetical protein [Solirubrobacter deserti]|uniref:DUF4175 domain-containing protein n=1 Tax=Solirubrobacter deserti TaxID=2282478 RepID=A0ABT4RVJ9_9ACTN|nr:hypothetical protein [Solirubrobacter deserti]MDA0142561.1 hypothetical protein [Solirubrobacter deserti]